MKKKSRKEKDRNELKRQLDGWDDAPRKWQRMDWDTGTFVSEAVCYVWARSVITGASRVSNGKKQKTQLVGHNLLIIYLSNCKILYCTCSVLHFEINISCYFSEISLRCLSLPRPFIFKLSPSHPWVFAASTIISRFLPLLMLESCVFYLEFNNLQVDIPLFIIQGCYDWRETHAGAWNFGSYQRS